MSTARPIVFIIIYMRLSFLDDFILERKDNEIASCHRWNMLLNLCRVSVLLPTIEKQKRKEKEKKKMTKRAEWTRERERRTETDYSRAITIAEHIPTESIYLHLCWANFCFVEKSLHRLLVSLSFFFYLFFYACFSCLRRALYKCQCCINGTWNLNVPVKWVLSISIYVFTIMYISLLKFVPTYLPQLHTLWRRH